MMQSVKPRPGGGFNPGAGAFGEHMDEAAMQQAVQQKALGQQGANAASAAPAVAQQKAQQQQQAPPPEMGSIKDELLNRPVKKAKEQLNLITDPNAWVHSLLGSEPNKDDPEKQAKKQKMLQRYNKLTAEQQEVAKREFQIKTKREEARRNEEEQKKQIEAQKKDEGFEEPQGKKSGEAAMKGKGKGGKQPMTRKRRAVNKLQQDRKTLGGPASAN